VKKRMGAQKRIKISPCFTVAAAHAVGQGGKVVFWINYISKYVSNQVSQSVEISYMAIPNMQLSKIEI